MTLLYSVNFVQSMFLLCFFVWSFNQKWFDAYVSLIGALPKVYNFLPASHLFERISFFFFCFYDKSAHTNFLNQINDNRNKIDMSLLDNGWSANIYTRWMLSVTGQKKGTRLCHIDFCAMYEWSWHLIHLIARFTTLSFQVCGTPCNTLLMH